MASNRDTHPAVVAARAVAAQLDERTRIDRAANCLTHGHPYGEVVETGAGRFCPHCCDFLDPEPNPEAIAGTLIDTKTDPETGVVVELPPDMPARADPPKDTRRSKGKTAQKRPPKAETPAQRAQKEAKQAKATAVAAERKAADDRGDDRKTQGHEAEAKTRHVVTSQTPGPKHRD